MGPLTCVSELQWRFCPSCRDDRPFEVPQCGDGHGHDCPDLACTICGFGLCLGPDLPQTHGRVVVVYNAA